MKTLLKRLIPIGIAATLIAATALISSPALADTSSTSAPVVTPDPTTTYNPILVTEIADSNVYYLPGQMITGGMSISSGMSWYVLGQDTTGEWVNIMLGTCLNVWVQKSVMALSPTTPLPVISTPGPNNMCVTIPS